MSRFAVCVAVLAALLPMAAVADEMAGGAFLGHNGSTLQMFSGPGDRVEYRYTDVRPGLSAKPGSVLFRGTTSKRGQLKGTAYIFKKGCPPAGYAVTGQQHADRIELRGAAPVHAAGSCAVSGYDTRGASARLVFTIAE